MEDSFVLKVGGSVIYDKALNINLEIITKVKSWYLEEKNNLRRIAIIVGGGSLSRDMQERIAGSIGGQEYLHNIAMSVTQTNAALLQGYFDDPTIFLPKRLGDAYEFLQEKGQKTLISGGLKVGWSTDMDAAVFADIMDVNTVYKLSDIDYLYDCEPEANPGAKPILDITWEGYFKMFNIIDGASHSANGNIPIDVNCAQFCSKKGISFFICGGKSISTKNSIKEILTQGTLIHP